MKPTKEEMKDMKLVRAIIDQYDGWEEFLCILMNIADAQNNRLLSDYLWQALEKGYWCSTK